MAKVAILRNDIYQSGGIETWLYNIAKKYNTIHDITIYYDRADKKQLRRLQKLVRCVEYTGQNISVDTAIWCYDFLGFNTVTAKRKVHVVHADYGYNYKMDIGKMIIPHVDSVYAVSKLAAQSASKIFGRTVEVVYNPPSFDVHERPIKMVSATRLTQEKGLWRMIKLDNELSSMGVDYTWDIYTPSYKDEYITSSFSKNVNLKKPILGIMSIIKHADLVVQLSDTESFGYTIVESMSLGTKVVTTDIPVLKELGINKHNAIIVPLRKHFVNYKKIAKKISYLSPYVPPYSDYNVILGEPSKSNYNPSLVKNTSNYDILLPDGNWIEPGDSSVVENYNVEINGIKKIK